MPKVKPRFSITTSQDTLDKIDEQVEKFGIGSRSAFVNVLIENSLKQFTDINHFMTVEKFGQFIDKYMEEVSQD